ncbi:hypothetical protein EWB00_009958 [Schistosoma japonicum]|uniref:Uncharacterized protein n=1 Tax=Schistosoma japonicum TaxID=6182 RepID=A0A4Z2CL81_SCHJA|nr:hypothetical protein EWB00_009958 [Schistosoma japonicum]
MSQVHYSITMNNKYRFITFLRLKTASNHQQISTAKQTRCTERLVVTPLTDRYALLAYVMLYYTCPSDRYVNGWLPAGPAGTEKVDI